MPQEESLPRRRQVTSHHVVRMRRALPRIYVSGTGLIPLVRLPATHLVSQAQHDSMALALIRHPGVPQPQIPDHDVPAADRGLHGRPDVSPRLERLLRDGSDGLAQLDVPAHLCWVGRDGLVCHGGMCVRTEPELGRAVLDGEVAEWDVGDEEVRILGMVEG